MPDFLSTADGRRIAVQHTGGRSPGIVFLGGFRSDMTGTKALALEAWARAEGRAFLRFDYSGHGASGGAFGDGCIGDWADDARAVMAAADGPQVLVGSSMGGWISLLIARETPGRVAGLVTIAAAPDFTDALRAGLTAAEQAALATTGRVERPSGYADTPYVFTRRLIEDGARQSVLTAPLALPMPVRMLQGEADAEVPVATALRLFRHATGPDVRLTLVKGADHRFSTADCLRLIETSVAKVSARAAG